MYEDGRGRLASCGNRNILLTSKRAIAHSPREGNTAMVRRLSVGKQRSILIIGAGGFIGRHLFRHMEESPNWHPVDARQHGLDLLDMNSVRRTLDVTKPHDVVNLAAVSTLDESDISLIYRLNGLAIVELADYLRRIEFNGRLVNTSSCLVYGMDTREPVSECHPLEPVHHYAVAKAMADQCLAQFVPELDCVSVRPFNVIGRDQNPSFVVSKLVTEFRERRRSVVLGDTTNRRDFVDVRDLAAMYEAVLSADRPPPSVNFCSGVATSIDDIVTSLSRATRHRMEVVRDSQLMRSTDNRSMCGDNRILLGLGFRYRYSLQDTLAWMLS